MSEVQPDSPRQDGLLSQIAELSEQETRVHRLLVAAGQQLEERQGAVDASVAAAHGDGEGRPGETSEPRDGNTIGNSATAAPNTYEGLVERVRNLAAGVSPPGSVILVVSRGDPKLLEIQERTGWHFPRDDRGVYAGYYPATSAVAIAHLKELHGKGANYLVFPRTAFWWLDHYRELTDYLENGCRRAWRDDSCAIYELIAGQETDGRTSTSNWLAELILDGESHASNGSAGGHNGVKELP